MSGNGDHINNLVSRYEMREISDQVRVLAVRLAQLSEQIAVTSERDKHFEDQMNDITKNLEQLNISANRWKGGIVVVVAIGSIVGWLASIGGNIARLWGH